MSFEAWLDINAKTFQKPVIQSHVRILADMAFLVGICAVLAKPSLAKMDGRIPTDTIPI